MPGSAKVIATFNCTVCLVENRVALPRETGRVSGVACSCGARHTVALAHVVLEKESEP